VISIYSIDYIQDLVGKRIWYPVFYPWSKYDLSCKNSVVRSVMFRCQDGVSSGIRCRYSKKQPVGQWYVNLEDGMEVPIEYAFHNKIFSSNKEILDEMWRSIGGLACIYADYEQWICSDIEDCLYVSIREDINEPDSACVLSGNLAMRRRNESV
jgi:hypothetical protein